jgi:hypothetical protein
MDLTTLTQPPWLYVLIAVAVVIVGLIIWGVVSASRRKSERERLRERYGSEYDRTVAMHRNTRSAVADLKEREQLHDELELSDLNDADRDLIRRHMASLQYRFVDDPADVMLQTERVVTEVLRAKGYPVAEDRERALRLFSVDHPEQAGAVRTALEGSYDGDVSRMREAFLDVRAAIQSATGVSYVLGDATDRPEDLHVEHQEPTPLPAGETST